VRTTVRWRTIGLVAALVAGGCARTAGRAGDVADTAAGAEWIVRIGSVGGITGGGSGHWIGPDGTVRRWSRITPQDSLETRAAGRTTDIALRDLKTALDAPALAKTRFESTGNMTVFLEWIEPAGVHHWSWPEGTSDAKIPSAVRRAYVSALAAVAAARPPR